MPKSEDMPGPYCAIGATNCKDLDYTKVFVCPTCAVYKDYNLMNAKPVANYFKNGKAT